MIPRRLWLLNVLTGLLLLLSTSVPAAYWESTQLDKSNIQLGSVYAAVMDVEEGEFLYEKHASRQVPIASITKLMTALVILDSKLPLNEYLEVVVPEHSSAKNAYSRIRIGSTLKRGDLLRIALMASENLAAYVVAHHFPGGVQGFVSAMNEKAQTLGMKDTYFVDSTGLSVNNKASAADLLKLVVAAYENPKIREYSTTRQFTANFKKPRYRLGYGNTNLLVHRKSWPVKVSKTGYLKEAGRCLVMVTEIEGKPVAMALLDSKGKRTPIGDAGRVKRWLTTGKGGKVAKAALRYQQERLKSL